MQTAHVHHHHRPNRTVEHCYLLRVAGDPVQVVRPSDTISAQEPPLASAAQFAPLFGKSVLLILDAENITYSARERGYEPDYQLLADEVHRVARHSFLHAFYAREAEHAHYDDRFTRMGWTPHPFTIHTVEGRDGPRKRANSDSNILFHAGVLVCRHPVGTVLIASGDGDLVSDLVSGIKELHPQMEIMTLSVPGSTSHRIMNRHDVRIATNILLKRDYMTPMARWHE